MEMPGNEPPNLPFVPPHLERLRSELSEFLKNRPDREQNVFLMMPFAQDEVRAVTYGAIETALAKMGFTCCRADQPPHLLDRLWDNVCIYMLACQYGIVVYDAVEKTKFNPNVSVEAGFMLALGRQILFLRDARLPEVPSDLRAHYWANFDHKNLEDSIGKAVTKWATILKAGSFSGANLRFRNAESQKARDLPGLICRSLASYSKNDPLPENEFQVLQAINNTLSSAGFDSFSQQPNSPLANPVRPYLSSGVLKTAIQVAFCNSRDEFERIVEEIVSDTRTYKTEFRDVVCVVFDVSSTHKESFFKRDLGGLEGIHLVFATPA